MIQQRLKLEAYKHGDHIAENVKVSFYDTKVNSDSLVRLRNIKLPLGKYCQFGVSPVTIQIQTDNGARQFLGMTEKNTHFTYLTCVHA